MLRKGEQETWMSPRAPRTVSACALDHPQPGHVAERGGFPGIIGVYIHLDTELLSCSIQQDDFTPVSCFNPHT